MLIISDNSLFVKHSQFYIVLNELFLNSCSEKQTIGRL